MTATTQQRPAIAALLAALRECSTDPTTPKENTPVTRSQLDAIPPRLLKRSPVGALELIDWLRLRGWQMSLFELEAERAHRGIPSTRRDR